MFSALPNVCAWRHHGAREGFETTFFRRTGDELVIEGSTSAVEGDQVWAVQYMIQVDATWRTRVATITGHSIDGVRRAEVRALGDGGWTVDGRPAPELDGCVDIDLEASACTNLLPLHRFALDVDEAADSPAAYVRAYDITVVRLEQEYRRLESASVEQFRYWYRSTTFDFEAELLFDRAGVTLEYPGIASRVR